MCVCLCVTACIENFLLQDAVPSSVTSPVKQSKPGVLHVWSDTAENGQFLTYRKKALSSDELITQKKAFVLLIYILLFIVLISVCLFRFYLSYSATLINEK